MADRLKPVGTTGPIRLSREGVSRQLVEFPEGKREREAMIATLFVSNAGRFADPLAPFSQLVQLPEDNLDFSVQTQRGQMYLELAEFAPLSDLGVTYETAPRHLSIGDLADLLCRRIREKSVKQGRSDCLLVIYKTHARFLVPPPAIELVRRRLQPDRPKFHKVYFLSPHDQTGATVSEVFPGTPHSFFSRRSDAALASATWWRFDFDEFVGTRVNNRR